MLAVSARDRHAFRVPDEGGVVDLVEEILRGEQEGEAADDECQGRRRNPYFGHGDDVS